MVAVPENFEELHESGVLTVAVVADLHAYDRLDDDTAPPSFLCTTIAETEVSHHPIAGLLKLIDDETLKADLLMCCGDLGDKARPGGIIYAWEALQRIKKALKARKLTVTAGNHDVDSRHHNDFDAKGLLQSLTPAFPLEDDALNNKFWARNYVVLTEPEYRLVILNTSAYHGQAEEEFEHGRVASRTVQALRNELELLEKEAPRQLNMLLCHHHPHNLGDVEENDASLMKGAQRLLELLGSGDFGNWIVIHGHKHHPRIGYAAATIAPPIIFSAGSLSAKLYEALQTQARNQFYLIKFPLTALDSLGLGLVGTFQAWDWIENLGWQRANIRSGLPAFGGFGNRTDVTSISKQIASLFAEKEEAWIDWNEVVTSLPQIIYLLPTSLDSVIKRLESSHELIISFDRDQRPVQVAKA